MRSPLSDLAKRERVFSSEFLSHSRSEESGLCPSYRYPWETKRATEGKGYIPLGLWRGEGREEDVLRASFFASCTFTIQGALRPRGHSGRRADHYISRHQSRREASYLSLIHLPGNENRPRMVVVVGSRILRGGANSSIVFNFLWQTPSIHRTRAIREERLGSYSILSTMPIDEVLRFRSILRCNRFDPPPR